MYFVFFLLVQVLCYFPSTFGVQYEIMNVVPNTPGGSRFDTEIGIPFAHETMTTINNFIWDTFQQYNNSDRQEVEVVKLFIAEIEKDWQGVAQGNVINISSTHLGNYEGDNLKWDFTSLMYHEMTHVFQWSGGIHPTPGWLIEGMAEYIKLKANYMPNFRKQPGEGDKWDEGYDTTARFLEYCESLKSGFVAKLNRMMRTDYRDDFFIELLGKSTEQLWNEYKAKYAHKNI